MDDPMTSKRLKELVFSSGVLPVGATFIYTNERTFGADELGTSWIVLSYNGRKRIYNHSKEAMIVWESYDWAIVSPDGRAERAVGIEKELEESWEAFLPGYVRVI